MFTGLVEEVGSVLALRKTAGGIRLTVACPTIRETARVGDSIAINGTCLTLTGLDPGGMTFEAVAETVRLTNLILLKARDRVNLERSLPVGGRLGGHFVTGHVDGQGRLLEISHHGDAHVIRVEMSSQLARFVAAKGSITVDGTSLTVVDVLADSFTAWVIPHTWTHTTLAARAIGDLLNLEVDILARYVERLMAGTPRPLTLERLAQAGFD